MKTFIKQILLATIVSLSLFSCSKDDGDEDIVNISQPENIRLKTYSFNSTEYPIIYNADGKVTDFGNTLDFPGTIVYNSDNKIIQFGINYLTYNSQGRISKITMADTNSLNNIKSNLTYNNNGLLAYQTLSYKNIYSGETEYIERLFAYNNNQLISITENNLTDPRYMRNLMSYDSNGNLSQVIWQKSSDGIIFTNDYTINYVYDAKKNPSKQLLSSLGVTSNFSLFYMFSLFTTDFNNYAFFKLSYYSNNNVISKQFIDNSGSTNSNYTYVYNDKGYPTSVEINRIESNGSNSISYRTWTYDTY